MSLLGVVRAGAAIYGSGGFTSYSREQLQGQLGGWVEQVIPRVKMKIGRDAHADIARVHQAREAIGRDTALFVDANGAYTRKEALAMATFFEDEGVTWFEEPVSSDDLEGLRLIRDRAPAGMEIAAGEYGYDSRYFRRMLDAGAVDVLQADATRCAGITGFLRVGAQCEAHCLPLSSHCGPSLHVLDLAVLERDLRAKVRGEVRFDEGSRALYATDSSNYRQVPLGVVVPKDVDDVIETVATCRSYGAPLLNRGGGTSLAGQTCNVAVIMDMSKYMYEILDLDTEKRLARAQPGLVLDDLRNAAEQHGLTFGPDPATHNRCTLGGMIGNNSCGVHAQMAGKTADNIEELEILTYDGLRMRVGATSDEELERIIQAGGRRGEIYRALKDLRDKYADLVRQRFPKIPRRVSGFNLDQLLPEYGFNVARALVGTESTCVTVLEATARLIHSPSARALVVLGYPDMYSGCDQIPEILKYNPIGLEGFDGALLNDIKRKGQRPDEVALFPQGNGWLMVEFGADSQEEALKQAKHFSKKIKHQDPAPDIRLFETSAQAKPVWEVREAALGTTALVPGEKPSWPGWEDSAVPPEAMRNYLRDLRKLIDSYHYRASFYGHFGQGCLHTRIDFDLETHAGIATFRAFINEAADLVVKYGGSFSGEHGDGQARAELLPKLFGEELVEAFREFKRIWDPQWKMNPGKAIDAYRIDENLRLGTEYNPLPVKTHFQFPEDEGSFAKATRRCVGVGLCRRSEGGTMCPSYMVTREEADSTRGRARLLFEMLQGDPLKHGWRDEHTKEALDLCLACKGCKGECPVNVDMATYKAEFLSHYYEGRLRPSSGYAMGWIYWWACLASLVPEVANFLTHAPLLRDLAKWSAGVAPQREMPTFAPTTFRQWFQRRPARDADRPRVMLWPDTFNNYLLPATSVAAVEVLEDAGFRVELPKKTLCCGRPLYDYGFLDLAKRLLQQVLDTLGPELDKGTCVVVLEPSCAAVFRDELLNLFPHDERAKRLASQTYIFSEFLQKHAPDYQPPHLARKAVVHGHCHHKAIMKMGDEQAVLKKLDLDYQMPETGCCGMAGAFGFEREHYDVSIKVGERVLLPAVCAAEKSTLVIADGFSCREQIAQTTDRQGLHLAQVMHLANSNKGDISMALTSPVQLLSAERRNKAKYKHPLSRNGDHAHALAGSLLSGLSPFGFRHDEQVILEHIREGRFQRSLALITAFSALLSGLEVTYEHYIGSYSQRVMYGVFGASRAAGVCR